MANEVEIRVRGDTRQLDRMSERFERFGRQTRALGLGLAAFGAVGVLAIRSVTSAAIEQERAERTLAAAVENTGASWASARERVLATTAALQRKTNFGDEEQLRVLTRMIPALGSYERALEALPAVLDAAAASGLQVSSVAGTLSRALAGMVNTSESTGLTFDKTAGFSERLALVFDKVGGAAEANRDPFVQLGNAIGDLKETIGAMLLPTLIPLVDWLRQLTERLQSVNPILLRIGVIAGTVAVAFAAIAGPILLFLGFLPAIISGVTTLIGLFSALKVILTGGIGIGQVAAGLATGVAAVAAAKGIASMQQGGIVTRPTLALVGERGPEAVVPLKSGRTLPGPEVHIHVGALMGNEAEARAFARLIQEFQRQDTRLGR